MTTVSHADHVDEIIDQRLDYWLERLRKLVNQPSISSQNVGMEDCAQLVAELLEQAGFAASVMPTEGYPMVYADAPGRGGKTLLCYNHYDVQPPEPLDLWKSPPFEASIRGGVMFGRGVQDDKGQFISRLAALSAVRDAMGELPCRIKFIVEGGEEISSPYVPEFIEEHKDRLQADACVWETGGVDYEGRPSVILGLRGICYVQLDATTMSQDAHSGGAHVFPNAAWRLVRALASIKDEQEHVLIDGFYDDVQEPTVRDLELLRDLPDDEDRTKASYGITEFVLGRSGFEAKRQVFQPTANIAGLASGYQGPGSKTVTPATALAKIDFRLVPDQDPIDVFEKLKAHLDKHGFHDIKVEYVGGERAGQTPSDDPFVAITIDTAREVYGLEPTISPMLGGSGPVAPFRDILDVPVVTLGTSHPDSLAHAPNENLRIDQFILGTRHMARLIQRFAEEQ